MNQNEPNLKVAGMYYLCGSLFNKGIGFITVPIFTRILSIEDYGIITTYNSWVVVSTMIMSLAIYMAIRASFVDYEGQESQFLSTITLFTICYSSILSSFVLIVSLFINLTSIQYSLIVLCLIHSLSNAVIENTIMFLMMKFKYKLRTFLMVFPNLAATVLSIILILFVFKSEFFMGRIIANSSVFFICFVFASYFILKKSKISFNILYIKYALKLSLPLLVHGLALSILSQSDKTMITSIRNSTETAIYGIVFNLSMIVSIIITAIDGIWVPYFTQNLNSKKFNSINYFAKKYLNFMTLFIICIIFIGPELLRILATKDYWDGKNIIPIMLMSSYVVFIYTFFVNIEHYYKKTIIISINTVISSFINIFLNYYFISKWGYLGASVSTFLSYIISLSLHTFYAKRLQRNLFDFKIYVYRFVIALVAIFIYYSFINNLYARWGMATLAIFLYIIHDKNFVISIFKARVKNNV